MSLIFWATTFDFVGKILIAITALLVHKRIKKAHRINKKVLKEMRFEQSIGFLGIILIVIGYILHLRIL